MKNKGTTKRKLLDAVGQIIKNEGFCGLGVNKVAKLSGVSKILIYRYFGDFTQLLRTHIMEKDFWMNYPTENLDRETDLLSLRDNIYKLINENFKLIYEHCAMEAMLVDALSNQNELVKKIYEIRLHKSDLDDSKKKNLNVFTTYVKVISTLLVAGTDHLVFSSHKVNALAIGDDDTDRQEELLQSIEQIVNWTFQ